MVYDVLMKLSFKTVIIAVDVWMILCMFVGPVTVGCGHTEEE